MITEETQRFGLTEVEKRNVLRHLIEGADLSAGVLANAVTPNSKEIDSYERATELEVVRSQIVELAYCPHEKRRGLGASPPKPQFGPNRPALSNRRSDPMAVLSENSPLNNSRPRGGRSREPLAQTASQPVTAAPDRTPKADSSVTPLEITETVQLALRIDQLYYAVAPIPGTDPTTARRAFWLTRLELPSALPSSRLANREVYTVRQMTSGWHDCTCPDFCFRQRCCKHITALVALAVLDREPLPPAARSTGDLAANYPDEYAALEDEARDREEERYC